MGSFPLFSSGSMAWQYFTLQPGLEVSRACSCWLELERTREPRGRQVCGSPRDPRPLSQRRRGKAAENGRPSPGPLRMAWMTPTLPLRAIACASWTTSLKMGTRTTWASLMRCASCGSQINPTESHCLPVPAGTARAAGTDWPALQLTPPALWQTTEQKAVIGAGGGLGPCMWARQEAMKEQSLLPHPGHGVGRIHPVWASASYSGGLASWECTWPRAVLRWAMEYTALAPYLSLFSSFQKKKMVIIITATAALAVKNRPTMQETQERRGFDPWVGKIP